MTGVSWNELIEPKVHLSFRKKQRKVVKEWFIKHFNEIHPLKGQLLIVSKEYDKEATNGDGPLPLDDLYNWYVSAQLPTSSTMEDLFSKKLNATQEQNNLLQAQTSLTRTRQIG